MCFRDPARCSTSIQCAIGSPYVFSIDEKYDAGPLTFGGLAWDEGGGMDKYAAKVERRTKHAVVRSTPCLGNHRNHFVGFRRGRCVAATTE